MKKKQLAALTLGLLTMSTQCFAAQALEDSSKQAMEMAGKTAAVGTVENNRLGSANIKDAVSFHVASLKVDSEVDIPNKVIKKVTADFQNKDIVFADFNKVTDALTSYARSHGNPAATAYVPAQSSADGVITVKVTAGRIGKVVIDDKSRLRESAVKTAAGRLRSGDVITTKNLETVLYTLNQLGGCQAVGVLSPGSEFGTSDITIKVREAKDSSVMLYVENYGSKTAGRYRTGLVYNRAQMNGTGDSLQISGLLSNEETKNYGIRYQTLAGHSDSIVGMSASRMTYDLDSASVGLTDSATGKANTYSLFGKTPVYTTTNKGLAITYGADFRELEDSIGSLDIRKDSLSGHLGFEGYQRVGKSYLSGDITGYYGNVRNESATAKTLNQVTETAGDYVKGVANVKFEQTFNKNWAVSLKGQTQQAGSNLDSSEDMYLGGINGVRAYPQGCGAGDTGYLGSLELKYHPNVKYLTLSTYLDAGHVAARKDGKYGDVSYTMKGWGMGVTYAKPADYFMRLDYARRIGFDDDLTDKGAKDNGRFWFMAGKVW